MLIHALLVAHIVVLGYWLGSELVINSTYRYMSWADGLPFEERNRLLDHVLDVDQHVRYAMVLQAGLGTALAAYLGYLPGGPRLALAAGVLALLWLALVEVTHRWRKLPRGRKWLRTDMAVRYALITVLLGYAVASVFGVTGLPSWLAWKLALFAGTIASGLGIRTWLIRLYRSWPRMGTEGSTPELEKEIRHVYVMATATLGLLWVCIAGITLLSVFKP
ncbi:MAG TPA: hypothetical protein PKH39_19130 [Woeseiaceae bacterium]|nr:hypothetical protein [Woeseiaceae bacterium]